MSAGWCSGISLQWYFTRLPRGRPGFKPRLRQAGQVRSPSCDWYRIYPGNYARRISVTRFPLQCKLQCSCNSLPPFGMSVNLLTRRSRFPLGTHQVSKKANSVLICIVICTFLEAAHGPFRTCTSYNYYINIMCNISQQNG